MAEDSLLQATNEIEKAVGVKTGFFVALLKEDDWSFVIKLHALVEAAITHLLVVASGNERLGNVYALLELSDNRKGKLAFVRGLDLLNSKYRHLIKTLSEVRNKLVHDVKNVGITLDEFVKQLDEQQSKNFVKAVMLDFDFNIEIGGKDIPIRQFIVENPKFGIWMAVMNLFGDIYIQKEYLNIRKSYLESAEKVAKAVHGEDVEWLHLPK
jgi:hypothetical protein